MKIYEDLSLISSPSAPCILTIGSFDGVHLGHQTLLKRMRELAGKGGTVAVVTFSNHPSHAFRGRPPTSLILSKQLKLSILKEYGVDILYCIEFTPEFAQFTYWDFLEKILRACPFDFLVLGEDARFGKNREGTRERIEDASKKLGFKLEYLSKITLNGETISSGSIRKWIQEGDLKKAAKFLGRPFQIEGIAKEGKLFHAPHLTLPPEGDFPVEIIDDKEKKGGSVSIQNGTIFLDFSGENEKIRILFK